MVCPGWSSSGDAAGATAIRTIDAPTGPHYAPDVRAYALVELGDSEAIDLFLREEDAERALADCLQDEPAWIGTPHVEPIELDEHKVSPN